MNTPADQSRELLTAYRAGRMAERRFTVKLSGRGLYSPVWGTWLALSPAPVLGEKDEK